VRTRPAPRSNRGPASGTFGSVPAAPVFYFDYSSPYAYLAAMRIADVLPRAVWRPIAFGFVMRAVGKVPWSLRPGRESGMRDIEERAAERGLPPVRWPEGWPDRSYSLLPLRGAVVAERHGRLREFSFEVYRLMFAEGRTMTEPAPVLAAAEAAGLNRDAMAARLENPEIKAQLRSHTDEAIALGVTGVPTIAVGRALFWGDDQLEAAAAAAAA
jgi:2-hydroxychromene-2-carboxylate isomerase